MIHPVIKLIMDTRQTAPAAISFTCFISILIDVVTMFESFSIVVFIISNPNTSAEQKRTASHSEPDILKTIPQKKAIAATINCIRKFFSEQQQYFIPCHAYLKEFISRIK